ncbi:4Fe-4S binding protein [Chloroflexota bacterium]
MYNKHCEITFKQPNLAQAKKGFTENIAREEAKRCYGNLLCDSCDLCRLLCPDLCITRDNKASEIVIDHDWCKGCGICAEVCPKGAISLVFQQ